MMRLGRLKEDKKMMAQQDVCWIINTLKAITKLIAVDLSKQKMLELFNKLTWNVKNQVISMNNFRKDKRNGLRILH